MTVTRVPNKETARWTLQLPSSSGIQVSIRFRHIPACSNGFLMGSRGYSADEEPIHRVVISEDFWMGETPITQAQFDCWPGAKERGTNHYHAGNPDHPAENLNWYDAVGYCDWLTVNFHDRFPKGFPFASLPCEAQWEYACRGDATGRALRTEFHTGDGEAALAEAGWYSANSDDHTHPVAKKLPNDFGLYDMHGNVWEWCLDAWDTFAYRRRWDGISNRESHTQSLLSANTEFRLMRGGSIWFRANWCRSAFRYRRRAISCDKIDGFRVCLVCSALVEHRSASAEQKDS